MAERVRGRLWRLIIRAGMPGLREHSRLLRLVSKTTSAGLGGQLEPNNGGARTRLAAGGGLLANLHEFLELLVREQRAHLDNRSHLELA